MVYKKKSSLLNCGNKHNVSTTYLITVSYDDRTKWETTWKETENYLQLPGVQLANQHANTLFMKCMCYYDNMKLYYIFMLSS